MVGRRGFGDYHNACFTSSLPFRSFFASGSCSSFLGMSSMVSFKDVYGEKRSERTFFHAFGQDEICDDDFDDYFHQPEKKRRLTIEQAQFLEKCFEAENKLEPERKVQLAKDLDLQPRQVAIWFQNRRARWKSKQLEKDFDTLQASYDSLKDDYDNLFKEKEKLQDEVVLLSNKLRLKERELGDHSNSSNLCDHQLNDDQLGPIIDSASESEDQHHVSTLIHMHEDLTSAKSDILDSDISNYAEPCNSSYFFDADQSDISQDDEDCLNRTFLPVSHVLLKIEDLEYFNPTATSYNLELSGEDHASQFWSYWDINGEMIPMYCIQDQNELAGESLPSHS